MKRGLAVVQGHVPDACKGIPPLSEKVVCAWIAGDPIAGSTMVATALFKD